MMNKEFEDDHKTVTEIRYKLRAARDQYNEGKIRAKYDHLPIDVEALKCKVDALRVEQNQARDRYAQHVFNYYSATKPILIRDVSKEEVSWRDAFGESFDDLSDGLRDSLVALIEEDGGQYRLA